MSMMRTVLYGGRYGPMALSPQMGDGFAEEGRQSGEPPNVCALADLKYHRGHLLSRKKKTLVVVAM